MASGKYKEKTTVVAVHNAFEEDEQKLPGDLVPEVELHRDASQKLRELRIIWGVDEEDYLQECLGRWESFGAQGLSGSMFFHSANKRYLLKSLGRAFETRFLHKQLSPKYFEFVRAHPDSLIYDVLYSMERRFGEWMKISPNHYIVIENIAYGKEDDWETFDLRPTSYLEPVRDLLPHGIQVSGVTDVLPRDKMVLTTYAERASLLARARADVAFLAFIEAIDYSVLLEPRARATKKASGIAGLPQQTVTADADGYAEEVLKMLEKCVSVR